MLLCTYTYRDRIYANKNSFQINGLCGMNIAAAILAGGKASRLGGLAKGNLIVHNHTTIIQHLLEIIKATDISPTIIVANDNDAYKNYGVKIVSDLWRDVGPLAGIASALNYYTQHQTQLDGILILPCDLPNITINEILQLIHTFYFHKKPIVFAATDENEWHPLCAVISCNEINRVSTILKIQQAITNHKYKIRQVWQEIGAEVVMFPHNKNFRNINTRADIKTAKQN